MFFSFVFCGFGHGCMMRWWYTLSRFPVCVHSLMELYKNQFSAVAKSHCIYCNIEAKQIFFNCRHYFFWWGWVEGRKQKDWSPFFLLQSVLYLWLWNWITRDGCIMCDCDFSSGCPWFVIMSTTQIWFLFLAGNIHFILVTPNISLN